MPIQISFRSSWQVSAYTSVLHRTPAARPLLMLYEIAQVSSCGRYRPWCVCTSNSTPCRQSHASFSWRYHLCDPGLHTGRAFCGPLLICRTSSRHIAVCHSKLDTDPKKHSFIPRNSTPGWSFPILPACEKARMMPHDGEPKGAPERSTLTSVFGEMMHPIWDMPYVLQYYRLRSRAEIS